MKGTHSWADGCQSGSRRLHDRLWNVSGAGNQSHLAGQAALGSGQGSADGGAVGVPAEPAGGGAIAAGQVGEGVDRPSKKNPGKLSYGFSGSGTPPHLGMEMFKLMTGTQMVHVPYKAAQQAIAELIAGQVHLLFDNFGSIVPHVKAGRVRGLGVTSLKRSPALPELPTLDRQVFPVSS